MTGAWGRVWSTMQARTRQSPTLWFGVPFVVSIVGGSFVLAQFTQLRYTHHDSRIRTLSQEEKLHLKADRRPLDIREEYFKLQSQGDQWDEWEPKRVERPTGMPEWGGVPTPAPAGHEAVDADLNSNSASSMLARRGWGRRPIEAEERHSKDEAETMAAPPPNPRKPTVVLGPDGKPCRACNTKLAFGAALRNAQAQPSTPTKPAAKTAAEPCPPDVEELGHSTWTFLHSAAAYYPDEPSTLQQSSMRALLDALPHVYPCYACAEELQDAYQTSAFNDEARAKAVRGGDSLRQWLCELHNGVNVRLGKPEWDCSDTERLRHRWYEPADDADC